jgi:molybdopterin-guanine dinucleotide biosynthesis protein MobB
MLQHAQVPILGFAAFSGTGKTTLLRRLLPRIKDLGLSVGLVKHAHHKFEIDYPGKDSFELRKAGATKVLVASSRLKALVTEIERAYGEPRLDELLSELPQGDLDLILVEGFKHEAFPKIELHRPALGRPLLFPDDPDVIAIASDAPIGRDTPLPLLGLNDMEGIAEFVLQRLFPGRARARGLRN